MYYGGGKYTKKNDHSQSLTHDFVSLALKGRTDGFDLKGGDATQGTLATQYSGPRPNRTIAGTCGGPGSGASRPLALEKCAAGNAGQEWGFMKEKAGSTKHQIASGTHCLDINNYGTKKGSTIQAYQCDQPAIKDNENWALNPNGTLSSLQPNTPFCIAARGTITGSGIQLDDCGAASASFKVGFTASSGTGTIVHEESGLCLTMSSPCVNPCLPFQWNAKPAVLRGNQYEYSMIGDWLLCVYGTMQPSASGSPGVISTDAQAWGDHFGNRRR